MTYNICSNFRNPNDSIKKNIIKNLIKYDEQFLKLREKTETKISY